jgi:hypothetical protein
LLDLDAKNNVLENLIQGVAGMQAAIGVRRPIVQDELVIGRPVNGLPFVEFIGASLDILSLLFGQRARPGTREFKASSYRSA